jgi:hypothetical protein
MSCPAHVHWKPHVFEIGGGSFNRGIRTARGWITEIVKGEKAWIETITR